MCLALGGKATEVHDCLEYGLDVLVKFVGARVMICPVSHAAHEYGKLDDALGFVLDHRLDELEELHFAVQRRLLPTTEARIDGRHICNGVDGRHVLVLKG